MADIILKDNQGIEQTYSGVKELNVLLADGTEQTYAAGVPVEKTVNLDFSSGENMVVVPDTGKFFEKVTIIKPASLVESNIAKDVDVAGIIGTHEGGDNETARVEYTYDDSGNVISASFVNMEKILTYALYYQTKVTTVDLSRSPNLTAIDSNAFYYCSALTSITLPETLKTVETSAFAYCAIKTVYFEGTLEDWLSITFSSSPLGSSSSLYINGAKLSGEVVIPDTVTSIGQYAFYYQKTITSVEIPDTVTSIRMYAFYYCRGLTSVEIPDTVTSIGAYAFRGNYITSAVIGSGVTSFGSHAFGDCTKLKSVTLKEGLTTLGEYMFSYCTALTSITIPASVTKIGTYAFSSCSNLSSVIDGGSTGWYVSTSSSATSGTSVSLTAYNLTTKYKSYYWFRKTT